MCPFDNNSNAFYYVHNKSLKREQFFTINKCNNVPTYFEKRMTPDIGPGLNHSCFLSFELIFLSRDSFAGTANQKWGVDQDISYVFKQKLNSCSASIKHLALQLQIKNSTLFHKMKLVSVLVS